VSAVKTARAWILCARPQTLTAAAVPVVVGSAVALRVGGFRWGPALAALFGAFAIQIGTNFANDVFDHEKGADTEARLGPTRAVAKGLLSARAVRRGMWIAFGLAAVAGVYLMRDAGWPVVAIGVASVLAGIAYTGGPYPLGYHGLGDVFVLLFFGFVAVVGTTFVETHTTPPLAFCVALAVGALATAILVVNNLRDRMTDEVAGKRTLAVRWGRGGALAEYAALVALAYVVPVALVALGWLPPMGLLPLLSLPIAAVTLRKVFASDGRALNPLLGATARLLALYGVLLAVGIGLG
jgi:1,4-dihydroxy-2-naphthoate polyprenyltransferase